MWHVVPQITTGLSLVALIAALTLYAYRSKLKHRRDVINTLPRQQRAEVITKELNTFGVDAKNLTNEQQYNLAIRQLDLRAQKSAIGAIIAAVAMLVFGGVAIFAISTSATPTPPKPDTIKSADDIGLLGGCSLAGMPVSLAPHETIHFMPINPRHIKIVAWEGLDGFNNKTDQPIQWPSNDKIKEAGTLHSPPFMYDCEISNLGQMNLINVIIQMRFWFGNKGGEANAIKHETTISPLNAGQSTHFYIVNDCDINTSVILDDIAKVKAVGSEGWRVVPLNRKFQNMVEQIMMFFPSKVRWYGGEACE